ncbi:LysE family translocator [Marinomonas sp. TW1]|uniref:LysE family translocator n=1 Tax=Marinomonas sp. TW1 TaxID=1561203 RepID=UPI0007AF7BED|nr:LysE family transporter [Marinomonas sp. TW1]KZN14870.1 lysine transporter LysE [Marinomonas sp. TW1]
MPSINHFELYSVIVITLLAVMSPGPDFAMVSKLSLLHGRRAGVLCALGIGLAISVHITYTLLGLGIVFANNVWALQLLRWLGAMYLIWLGASALWPDIKAHIVKQPPTSTPCSETAAISNSHSAFWSGFACNAFNPKTMLFIVSLFSQVISTETSLLMELSYGAYIALVHFLWFAIVATLLTTAKVQQKSAAFKDWIERVAGVLLMGLGIKLLMNH